MARHPYTKNSNASLPPAKPIEEGDLPRFVYSASPKDGDLNSGKPWSKWDEQDIRHAVEHGQSIGKTANFLCRTQNEVRDKAHAMGLRFKKQKARYVDTDA